MFSEANLERMEMINLHQTRGFYLPLLVHRLITFFFLHHNSQCSLTPMAKNKKKNKNLSKSGECSLIWDQRPLPAHRPLMSADPLIPSHTWLSQVTLNKYFLYCCFPSIGRHQYFMLLKSYIKRSKIPFCLSRKM